MRVREGAACASGGRDQNIAPKVTNRIMEIVGATPFSCKPEEKTMSGEWQLDSIQSILVRRDGMDKQEARDFINEMKERVMEGEDPEEVLHEIGLEPDYIWELIG